MLSEQLPQGHIVQVGDDEVIVVVEDDSDDCRGSPTEDDSDNYRGSPTEVALQEVNSPPPDSLEAPPTSHTGLEVRS